VTGLAKAQECVLDSSFAGSNVDFPTKIVVGKSARVRVNIFNSGTCTWDNIELASPRKVRKIRLSIKVIRKPSGSPYPLEEFKSELPFRNSVRPEDEHTWYYEITGPSHPGRYELEWTLTHKGKEFGVQVRKTIEVVAP
jgi:hypothetical protein